MARHPSASVSENPQSDAARLTCAVNRLRRRARQLRAERAASLGLAAGLGLGVLLRIAELALGPHVAAWWYAVVAVVPMLAAWTWRLLHSPDVLAVTMTADARLGLKDRTSSAIALRGSSEPMAAALIQDAAAHIESARPRAVFRRKLAGRLWPPAAAAAALALAVFLPQWPALQSAEARREHAVLKAKAQELERIAAEIEKRAEPQTEDIARQVAENMRRLAKDLGRPGMTEKKALTEMKKTAKQVAAARDKIEAKSSRKLTEVGAELADVAAQAAMVQQSERLRDLRELGQMKQAGLKDIETLEDLSKFDATDFEKFKNLNQLKGLSEEQVRRLAELAKRSQARELYADLKMPQDLLDALSELFAKEDYLQALELMQTLMDKLRDRLKAQAAGRAPPLTDEQMKRLQAEMKKLAEMLKNTNLDELAKRLRELADKLSAMDTEELLKLLEQCKGAACGCCAGLGLVPGLGAALAGLGCGVGPGDGMAHYVPGLVDRPSDISQRTRAQFGEVNVTGRVGDKGEVLGASEVYVPPSSKGATGKVPYYRVLPSYREQAEDALRREDVPPEHRARVKRYFDSLTAQ